MSKQEKLGKLFAQIQAEAKQGVCDAQDEWFFLWCVLDMIGIDDALREIKELLEWEED